MHARRAHDTKEGSNTGFRAKLLLGSTDSEWAAAVTVALRCVAVNTCRMVCLMPIKVQLRVAMSLIWITEPSSTEAVEKLVEPDFIVLELN